MKNWIFLTVALSALVGTSGLSSCESAAKKSTDADAKVMDAKGDLKKAEDDAAVAAQKATDAAEWKLFKLEAEGKIMENENTIGKLKEKKKSSGKVMDAAYSKSIEELEQRNKDLKARMEANDKGLTNWQAFKSEFNTDMNALVNAIGDLGRDSKK